jgi:D-alanyl-D-alanine carboxypeptidase/D-alanyl-D-alanine-endopeptidase (penicillin-binding protein 4)
VRPCLQRFHRFIAVACFGVFSTLAGAEQRLPADLLATLSASGLPLKSFGFYAQAVDVDSSLALAALNAEQPFVMASTTKLVTSLAALDLLGPTHRWRTQAVATGPVRGGRLAGDLVISGASAGMTPAELRRWFKQMRGEGLAEVGGNIVLERLPLLYEGHPAQAAATAREAAPAETALRPVAARPGSLVVAVQPASGERASVSLQPRPVGVTVINDVFMGDGDCNAWAGWRDARQTGGGPAQLWVRGTWNASCGGREIAYVRLPATARFAGEVALPSAGGAAPLAAVSTTRLVAALWAETGGKLAGRVIEDQGARGEANRAATPRWSSEFTTALPAVIREMNKTSNNIAARSLLLALSPPLSRAGSPLRDAQERVRVWLRGQGLADGDIRVDIGSGQSHDERGKPRALVQLLQNAWRAGGAKAFVDSLPIAGVDGTLVNRMRTGSATGQAYLKTGTLRDTRALAGYVRSRSGKVYAVAALVNDPRAGRATPTLDALIEWVAKNG